MKHGKLILGVLLLLGATTAAFAEPALQLYLEGATYDSATETWIGSGGPGPLRLWVIAWSPVNNVKLAVAYATGETPTIGFTPSTTGDLGGFTDPLAPSAPTPIQTSVDGQIPKLSDGQNLPSHGIYGPGTTWQEFGLGNFTLTDSPIADFINSFPSPGGKVGQINVYDVTVSGATYVHFDVYDTVAGGNSVFAPFSHDAGTVPAPAAALLGLIGLGTINLLRRRLLAA